ncbi:MAG: hypothetical protein AB1746_17040 [Candidatus Zixiibacteriota bacterium]
MKTSAVLSCLVLILAATAVAGDNPIAKRSLYLNGGAIYNYINGDWMEYSEISGSSTFGYFAEDHILLGVIGMFDYYDGGRESQTFYNIGPVIGYYFGNPMTTGELKGRFYPFIKGMLLYGKQAVFLSAIRTDESGNIVAEMNSLVGFKGTSFGGETGITFLFSRNMGLDIFARYLRCSTKYEDSEIRHDLDKLTFGLALSGYIY